MRSACHLVHPRAVASIRVSAAALPTCSRRQPLNISSGTAHTFTSRYSAPQLQFLSPRLGSQYSTAAIPQPPQSRSVATSASAVGQQQVPTMVDATVIDRVRGALWGLLIADSLSMPVHWYYDVGTLQRDFGTITDFQAPRARHPSSIMSVSNTGGHGRGGQGGRIIGDVINHGKHDFWGKSNIHYHQGMKKGENTLNALCARVIMRSMTTTGSYDPARALNDYVTFMTTPGSHNDTYAESFHRDFFKNFSDGVPAERCALGTEGHNTAQIGGFVMLPPVIMGNVGKGVDAVKAASLKHLSLTHDSTKLAAYATVYSELLSDVSTSKCTLKEAISKIGKGMKIDFEGLANGPLDDVRVVHSTFGSACYIQDSFPSMLFLAYRYADSFEKAVLANTNVGGENCHRGAALGALMGAALGESKIPRRLIDGLHDTANIRKEIDAYTAAMFPEANLASGSCL